jgi:hypothetical protein
MVRIYKKKYLLEMKVKSWGQKANSREEAITHKRGQGS